MIPSRSYLAAALLLATSVSSGAGQQAEVADPDPTRFESAIEDFGTWDTKNSPPDRAVLFVGSSTIRGWNTAERFPGLPIINRGFGGSHISDVNRYVQETVIRYTPDVVVFYAGDNDIGAGKSNDQVFEDYEQFVQAVLSAHGPTQILFLPIKPSLARWELWPQMAEFNERIRRHAENYPNLHYADVATPMLGSDGRPMPHLFVADGLHMTSAGYDLWTDVVTRALPRLR